MTLPWIQVHDNRLTTHDGEHIVLRGVGLGGWMNMENFISGYPGVESRMRRELLKVLGPEAYGAFFESYYDSFIGPEDAAHMSALGLNSVRLPIHYRHFEDDARPFELKQEGFDRLDRAIGLLREAGIWSIIDLHALPGAQNHHWHSDNPTHVPGFWQHRHFQDRVVHLWEALADRYKDEPAVAGYNPINEPADEDGETLLAFYQRLEKAIRAIDPRHVLFLDGNKYSTDFSVFEHTPEPLPNSVYTAHDYALPGIARATEYPGVTRGEYVDRDVVEQTFLRRTEYMRRTGTPIWIGEFGPVYPPDQPDHEWRYDLLQDQLDIYAEHGASWALWTYKDMGLQGLVSVDPDSAYYRRIAPTLQRKKHFGADAWGGSDAGVRHLIEPIVTLLAQEFPDYHPYPWGIESHVAVLVRHILLSEPLTEEFAGRFTDVDPEQAAELARDFRFDRCLERERLSEILRNHTRPQV